MADKDLLEIIARMTAKTVTDVSHIYYEQHPDSSETTKGNAAKDTNENGDFRADSFPFGTPVPDPESFSSDIRSYAKSLERSVRHRTD